MREATGDETRALQKTHALWPQARRICCWISKGQDVKRGDKFGMIRFGSRIEILVKRDALDVYLEKGQYVYGGQTVIGKWK